MARQIDCDGVLVKWAQTGQRHAFMRLVEKYQRRLMRLVSVFLNDPSDAEDMVQETFVTASRRLKDFDCEGVFCTWLYKIAIGAVQQRLGQGNRDLTSEKRRTLSTRGKSEFAADPNHSWFVAGVSTLPLELLATLVLRELEGLTYHEIGEVMTCSAETVRDRIFRAREIIGQSM